MRRVEAIKQSLGSIRPSKRLGQTFMVDPNLLEAMVRDAGITERDIALEVGTGIGALTECLARSARVVISVEIDRRLADIARTKFAAHGNVEIMAEDFLDRSKSVSASVEKRVVNHIEPGSAPVVVANLPYSESGPMIAALMLWKMPIYQTVVTIQKELAERIAASPGKKAYGKISVLVQSVVDVEILRIVPSECFWPRPKVDSAVIRFGPKAECNEHLRTISRLANGIFQHRRKTVRNALLDATNLEMGGEKADSLLDEAGVDKSLRADAITVAQFGALAGSMRGLVDTS